MPYVPAIPKAEPDMYPKLRRWLRHLRLYNSVANLRGAAGLKNYHFSFKERDGQKDQLEFIFKNTSGQNYFITQLCLSATYEITQIFPPDKGPSVAVQPNQEVPWHSVISVSDLLLPYTSDRDFSMTERYRLFITPIQTSFAHYQLPSLSDSHAPPGRTSNGASESNFYVEDCTFTVNRDKMLPSILPSMGFTPVAENEE
ncbi:hypothetical protein BDV41DRAFT_577508 [Aspergillus transmontanensis]|uniref:Uncharacterized protein n=1 Tax=Aspergillus transmontanensis TaxID=1034304 RepID=A0A5N6VWF7_9EURO|nr:hypothetical protein BDV41DRAFT_577508 [Aspergillus transmontanensis]